MKGSRKRYRAALRYMLFALIGSVLLLLGTYMIYRAYGTLNLRCSPTAFAPAGCVDSSHAHDSRICGKDSALSVAFVVATGVRCAGARQRCAVCIGREG